jgi:EmrB/QacA subfamily drug resistance transporter
VADPKLADGGYAGPGGSPRDEHTDPRRWVILAVLSLAQLMVVLDVTIVNIALPSMQRALDFSTADRQWVVTAYSLAFGGLLLVGGRLGDIFGRRRVFIVGLVGFATASAVGGAAQNLATLIVTRAVQGTFGALLVPSALALLLATFTDTRERAKALGVYTAIAGAGGAVGLLLGGALTEYVSWRWCFYINVGFAAMAIIGALALLANQQRDGRATLDVPGSLIAVGGLIAVVYGLSEASTRGWSSSLTLALIIGGVAALVAFTIVEKRVEQPLLPLAIPSDRTRGGAYLGAVVAGTGAIGMFLLVTYYLQNTLGYSPLRTGIAFLPFVAGAIVSANVVSNVALSRLGPKTVVPIAMLFVAAGAGWLAQLGVNANYGLGVAPALVLFGVGVSGILITAFSLGPAGAAPSDAGVSAAMVNSSNQIGGSLGAALLNTIAAKAAASYLISHPRSPSALTAATVHGNDVAFTVTACIFVGGAVLTGLVHRRRGTSAPMATPGSIDSTAPAPENMPPASAPR